MFFVAVAHFQRIGCQPEKNTIHGVANLARGLLTEKAGSAPPVVALGKERRTELGPMMIPKKAAPVNYGTILRTTGLVPADSRQYVWYGHHFLLS